MKLVTAAEMRALEEAVFASGIGQSELMETAGRAVARAINEHFGNVRALRMVVLVGPGNNGGDGLVAARHLSDLGAEVFVYLVTPRPTDDANLQALRPMDVEVVGASDDGAEAVLDEALSQADAVIDALLGTGRQRPLEGAIADVLGKVRDRRAPLFAIDLPTGVNADSGAVDPATVAVDATLTLGFSKIGLHLLPGADYAGEVSVLDIGVAGAESVRTELLTADWARNALPDRPSESNKGTYGRVMVVAGSESYTGAAALSCLGALRAGAGLVTLASASPVRAAVASFLPEVTHLALPESDGGAGSGAAALIASRIEAYGAMIIGPGLGTSTAAQEMVRLLLTSSALANVPTVIDADAINVLARIRGWQDLIEAKAVLTPHPGELARLFGTTTSEIQEDRIAAARNAAERLKQTVVLKGAHTLIAGTDGEMLISPFANAGLAAAGTGDVLAGTIGGLLAQGLEIFTAAGTGVYLHGAAAELYEDYGPSGLLASELGIGIARVAGRLRRGE